MTRWEARFDRIARSPLAAFTEVLRDACSTRLTQGHGDLPDWLAAIDSLPRLAPTAPHVEEGVVSFGEALSVEEKGALTAALERLRPWRKGPYRIHGVQIDSEWRSDMKWNRLVGSLAPLDGRLVLDVGCGNGYHLWRMLEAGARFVLGIDPTLLFFVQFGAIEHFSAAMPLSFLPLALEEFPEGPRFDTIFSMGVIHHRRSPLDHLMRLHGLLTDGGQLVLETLISEGATRETFVPRGRYAKMRNVWFIPTTGMLSDWLKRCGFRDVSIVDITRTTPEEQRRTPWMQFESLTDFLDPGNPQLTVEGYPAPCRAIAIAHR